MVGDVRCFAVVGMGRQHADGDMTKKRKHRESDVIARFHEDAKWSSYTNSEIRWARTGGFGSRRPHPSTRTALMSVGLSVLVVLTVTILITVIVWSLR